MEPRVRVRDLRRLRPRLGPAGVPASHRSGRPLALPPRHRHRRVGPQRRDPVKGAAAARPRLEGRALGLLRSRRQVRKRAPPTLPQQGRPAPAQFSVPPRQQRPLFPPFCSPSRQPRLLAPRRRARRPFRCGSPGLLPDLSGEAPGGSHSGCPPRDHALLCPAASFEHRRRRPAEPRLLLPHAPDLSVIRFRRARPTRSYPRQSCNARFFFAFVVFAL
mmetsp:Transcript_8219/g.25389  ORF Transcript_8219/g.25389 Transcript_8219/m.25389 type:complete len:218 (-) Transcript_8219:151-804(-)